MQRFGLVGVSQMLHCHLAGTFRTYSNCHKWRSP